MGMILLLAPGLSPLAVGATGCSPGGSVSTCGGVGGLCQLVQAGLQLGHLLIARHLHQLPQGSGGSFGVVGLGLLQSVTS